MSTLLGDKEEAGPIPEFDYNDMRPVHHVLDIRVCDPAVRVCSDACCSFILF